MNFLHAQFALWVAAASAAILVIVGAILAPQRLGALFIRLRAWLPALALIALVATCGYLQFRHPIRDRLSNSYVPLFFHRYYWCWVLAASLGLLGSAVIFWRGIRSGLDDIVAGGPLDETWSALLARLRQFRIDLWRQAVHLLLAPDGACEAGAANLIGAASMRVIAEAPAGPAPIHAHAVRNGVLLSCDGAWSRELQADGAARLVDLGKKLRSAGPDRPLISGLALLLPIEWAARSEAVDHAAVAGEEIDILYHVLKSRCPVLAIFTGLEAVPGAPEFIRRIGAVDPSKANARAGVAVPGSQTIDPELLHGAIDWIASWFHASVLDLLIGKLFDYRSNADLVQFDYEFRQRRRRLADILQAVLMTVPRDEDQIPFRGCYFAATGDEPGSRAFAAGLFHGPRHPILADRREVKWTERAIKEDAWYWWTAMGVGFAVALPAALVWWTIKTESPTFGWAGLAALAATWALVYWSSRVRKR